MRIAQAMPWASWGEVGPDLLKKGCGGRETAFLRLANCWATAGHEVWSFAPRSSAMWEKHSSGGMEGYLPLDSCIADIENHVFDVIVAWEWPDILEAASNAKVRLCYWQVAHGQFPIGSHDYIDAHVALSPWHLGFLQASCPKTEWHEGIVMPNGVDVTKWTDPRYHGDAYLNRRRKGKTFYYASSPDRGLHHLLRLWPRLRSLVPDAELHVAYGFNWLRDAVWSHNAQGEIAMEIIELLKQPGIIARGRTGQDILGQLQSVATAMLYTCDTMQPTETGCITAIEAMAAGAAPVLTGCDCLGDEFRDCAQVVEMPFDEDLYIEAVMELITDPSYYRDMIYWGRAFAEERDWKLIASKWLTEFEQRVAS